MLSLYRLPNTIEGETVIKVVRKDFFIIFRKIVLSLFMGAIYAGLLFFFIQTGVVASGSVMIDAIAVLATSAYSLFVILFLYFSFVDYYLDVSIVTSERIIDINQDGLFSRTISELKVGEIQDVTSSVVGVLPTILSFGHVEVQTAGEKVRFILEDVSNPEGIRDLIIRIAQDKKCDHTVTVNKEKA